MKRSLSLGLGFVLLAGCVVSAATIQVGPTRTYTNVIDAYNIANPGDTIEIDSGTYFQGAGWVKVIKADLTFRGVGATRPVLDAGNSCYKQKGIFVIDVGGNNTIIENLELKNARGYPAAGVRMQGNGLTLRNVYIHDCDNGVLNGGGTMLFEYCEFNHNGDGTGQTHNIYLNGTGTFTMQYCWSHNAVVGHQVKTRVQTNRILYNLISDDNGSGSYEVDIPDAGTSYVIGNCIYQGGYGNSGMIAYAEESSNNPDRHLYVVNNTIVSTIGGTFVWNKSTTASLLQNNILQGGAGFTGSISQVSNWITGDASLQNPGAYDYHLTAASTGAINNGTVPSPASGIDGFSLIPVSQYVAPYNYESRPAEATIDIGAYEYALPNQPPTVNAGTDLNVYEGAAVSLHAAASDPNNDPLTYAWTQPAGLSVALGGAATADATFTAPVVASIAQAGMTFTVTVSDTKASPVSDSINVRTWILGDINRDNSVDMLDVLALAGAWGCATGDASYSVPCDFNGDGYVDVIDLLILANSWGRTLN